MKKEKLYKLHIGLPAMTEFEWTMYANNLYQTLFLQKLNGRTDKDGIKFLYKIYRKFKIKTI